MPTLSKGRIAKSTVAPPSGGTGWEDTATLPTGPTLVVVPTGPEGNQIIEDARYAGGLHIPELLRWVPDGAGGFTAWGSNYNPAWYAKTDIPSGSGNGIPPGSLILIDATHAWQNIKLFGLKGTQDNPIWVRAKDDGQIFISAGIELNDCEYVLFDFMPASIGWNGGPHRDPTPTEAAQYRFQFLGDNPYIRKTGITLYGRCKEIHMRGIRIETCWYGVQAKTDPMCNLQYNFPAYNMERLTLKHLWMEDVLQDILYWGNSSHMLKVDDPLNGRDIYCDGGASYYDANPNYLPMKLKDTEVAYGFLGRCGRQPLVIGGCYYGKHRFHHLKIRNAGYELSNSQGEGIGNGGMSAHIEIDHCDIENTFLYSIAEFAQFSHVHDNRMHQAGFLDPTKGFVTDNPVFLTPTTDIPALLASRPDLAYEGGMIKNIVTGGIHNISATTKITYPTSETKTVFYYNNVMGSNSRMENVEGFFKFDDYGPAANWTTNNVIANNTRLSDGGPIRIDQFPYLGGNWPQYSTNPADIPPI